MKRLLLAVVGIAIVGLAIWLTRSDDTPKPATPEPAPQPVERAPGTTVTPSLPDQARVADDAGVTSYEIGGVPVRDHRTGSGAQVPLDLPPNIHPPDMRQIPPTLTASITKQVRGVLAECSRLLPADARGPKPRVDGEIIISIKSGVANIDKSMMQLRDVTGDPEPMKQCMEQKTVGLTTAASDQADLTNYSIHLSLVVLPTPVGP